VIIFRKKKKNCDKPEDLAKSEKEFDLNSENEYTSYKIKPESIVFGFISQILNIFNSANQKATWRYQ